MKLRSIPANITVVLPLLFILLSVKQVQLTLRIKNVRCHSPNISVLRFEYCKLNAVRRDFKDISLKMVVVHKPIRNSVITIQFLKRSNGYKPFMPDLKLDACSYLKKRNNFIMNTLMEVWGKYSNMNHTCPYDHDLIVEKMRFTESDFRWIPFPHGEYAFYAKFVFNHVLAAQIDFFLSILQD
ncbi:uncharacterized protein LOC126753749 [Bactrocera neohumeralis]|uniref:uncharacterized protein LOC126753749 n=1 Tax=Bactrocera neohumeralis TaxID=98809 RepID=UPI0021653204|nr:uncharacterized protein LOC126753749 [Bactrocera neohumeralis]